MRGRLFIIKNGVRKEIDLSDDSSITLNFSSPLFNDISNISHSYSYTFKLPRTERNAAIFDCIDDVRSTSTIYTKRIQCEYTIEGLPMFDNAYLYLNSVAEGYECCMVWGVIDGLVHIKDNDISINQLDEYVDYTKQKKRGWTANDNPRTLVKHGDMAVLTGDYDVSMSPYYGIGVPYATDSRTGNICCTGVIADYEEETFKVLSRYYLCPNQAIRIHALIDRICSYYGINLDLASKGDINEYAIETGNVFSHGFIPCVKNETSKSLNDEMSFKISDIHYLDKRYVKISEYDGSFPIAFDSISAPRYNGNSMHEAFFTSDYNKISIRDANQQIQFPYSYVGLSVRIGATVELDGKFTVRFTSSNPDKDNKPKTPTLRVLRMKRVRHYDDEIIDAEGNKLDYYVLEKDGDDCTVATLEGVFDFDNSDYPDSSHTNNREGTNTYYYKFNFKKSEGFERISFKSERGGSTYSETHDGKIKFLTDYYVYVLVVDLYDIRSDQKQLGEIDLSEITVIPKFENSPIYNFYQARQEWQYRYVDLYPNLPDISCIDFIKALFYAAGGFPYVDRDGRIRVGKYSEIRDNVTGHLASDWSNKILEYDETNVNFTVGDFARKNYYLMKNEKDTKEDDEETSDDIYKSSKYCIELPNGFLADKKTVIQTPFYDAYLSQGDDYTVETGNGVKLWQIEKGLPKPVEGKPCMMKLCIRNDKGTYLSGEVWSFDDFYTSQSMEYLKSILENPRVIEAKVKLSCIDLQNLDFLKPIFIERLNSYFAIIEIEWSSENEVGQVKLLKLPN